MEPATSDPATQPYEAPQLDIASLDIALKLQMYQETEGKLRGEILVLEATAEREETAWGEKVAELETEVSNLVAHRNALYRVFRALVQDDRTELSTIDEMIQADVDAIIAERIELLSENERARRYMAEINGALPPGSAVTHPEAIRRLVSELERLHSFATTRDHDLEVIKQLKGDNTRLEQFLTDIRDSLDPRQMWLFGHRPDHDEKGNCAWRESFMSLKRHAAKALKL